MMIGIIFLLAIIGFGISLYAYFTEQKIKNVPDYKPSCDISHSISCSKPLKSPYANLFIYSNATISMIFYALIALLAAMDEIKFIFYASVVACAASIVLAYLLYVKVKSFCLICTSLYVINFLLLIISHRILYS